MSYLKKFKIYKLKIDQSFVRDIAIDADDRAIVKTIVQMAHSVGLITIAEGVETSAQWEFLSQNGCDEVQGYLFSRPLPTDQIPEFVRKFEVQREIEVADALELSEQREIWQSELF